MDEKQILKNAQRDISIGIACKIFIRISGDPITFFDYFLKVSFMVLMLVFVIKGTRGFFKYNKMKKDKES